MESSILTSIKKLLGISKDYEAFDTDIIVHINSAIMSLSQLGVVPPGFSIKGKHERWSDLTESKDVEAIKTYIYLKVKLVFDPPTNSFVIDAMHKELDEYTWRIITQVERTV